MFDTHLNDYHRVQVRAAIKADPNIMLDTLSHQLEMPEGAVAVSLSAEMCTVAPAETFEIVWHAMCQWEAVTFIATSPGAIVEVKGRLPTGRFGYGYFNIADPDNPLSGHLRIDELEAICFVSKPFMGLESHSVRFYNAQGALMFAVYVGRIEKQLIPSVVEGFKRLRRAATEWGAP
jgi:putative heme utilization carrier protein HutX